MDQALDSRLQLHESTIGHHVDHLPGHTITDRVLLYHIVPGVILLLLETERDLFRLLIRHVSGIGPKLALNVLSGTTPASFRAAVAHGDVKALSCINGVGKKTAERIVVELKDKLGDETALTSGAAPTADDQKMADAISALIVLGSKPKDAQDAIRAAITMLGPDQPVDALVRGALQKGK